MENLDETIFKFWGKLIENKWLVIGSMPCIFLLGVIFAHFLMEFGIIVTILGSLICFIMLLIELFD